MLTIHWRSMVTGKTGCGQPIPSDAARAWVRKLNHKWPQILHWAE